MTRTDIIQNIIDKIQAKSYLEIGVDERVNFDKVICEKKVGVDPNPLSNVIQKTSDEFFSENKEKFDVIFIDGLHQSEQVKRDIENSLKILNSGGYIILHDCNPTTEEMQRVPRIQTEWTGDVWKAFLYFRTRKDLEMYVINCDYGCGIIKKGNQITIEDREYNWDYFTLHKKELLNLVDDKFC